MPEMMKYRKTGKFKLGFLTLLLSVLFVACGSGASDADRQIKSKTDLKGAVIGVQLGTTSDGLATELEKEGGGTKVERYNKGADAIQALLQGKIDCMVTDEAPAKAFQRVNPSLRILPETFDASSFAICVAAVNQSCHPYPEREWRHRFHRQPPSGTGHSRGLYAKDF